VTCILDPNQRPDFRQLHQKLTTLLKNSIADEDSDFSVSDMQSASQTAQHDGRTQYHAIASPTYSTTPNEVVDA
jgi:hypothetical protein